MSTTTTITITNPTTSNNTTTTRRARFSMILGTTNNGGVTIVGIIHRMANLNLGRTGTLISNTPGTLGRNISGRSTRTVGAGLRRTNTRMRLGWFCL